MELREQPRRGGRLVSHEHCREYEHHCAMAVVNMVVWRCNERVRVDQIEIVERCLSLTEYTTTDERNG